MKIVSYIQQLLDDCNRNIDIRLLNRRLRNRIIISDSSAPVTLSNANNFKPYVDNIFKDDPVDEYRLNRSGLWYLHNRGLVYNGTSKSDRGVNVSFFDRRRSTSDPVELEFHAYPEVASLQLREYGPHSPSVGFRYSTGYSETNPWLREGCIFVRQDALA